MKSQDGIRRPNRPAEEKGALRTDALRNAGRAGIASLAALALASCGQEDMHRMNAQSAMVGGASDALPELSGMPACRSAGYLAQEEVARRLSDENLQPDAQGEAELQTRLKSLVPRSQLFSDKDVLKLSDEEFAEAFTLAAAANPVDLDLRKYDTPIRNQGSSSLCTSFATIAAIENMSKRLYNKELDLSEIYHFQNYNVYQVTPSLNAGKSTPIVEERLCPWSGGCKNASLKGKGVAHLTGYKQIQLALKPVSDAIENGNPVVIGIDVTSSFSNPGAGGIVKSGQYPQGNMGHAITIVGVKTDEKVPGGGYFIIKNSWGPSYGDKGYAYVPFDYCRTNSCVAYSVSDVEMLANGTPVPQPTPSPSPTPTAVPTAAPTSAPTTTPSAPAGLPQASDFRLEAVSAAIAGMDSAKAVRLVLRASSPALLAKVRSAEFRMYGNGAGSERALGGILTQDAVETQSCASTESEWVSGTATLKMEDGSELVIPGITVRATQN